MKAAHQVFVILVLSVLLILLMHGFSSAREKHIRVAVMDSNPTFCAPDRGETCSGDLALQILNHVADREKWHLQITRTSLQNGFAGLDRGDFDLLACVPYSRQTSDSYSLSQETVLSSWAQVYTIEAYTVKSLLDLNGMIIGVRLDDPYNRALRSMLRGLGITCRFVELKSDREIGDALEKKWINAGVMDRLFALEHEKTFPKIKRTDLVLSPVEYRYAVSQNRNEAIIGALDYHLALLKKDQGSLYYRYMQTISGMMLESPLPAYVKWGSAVTVVLLMLFAVAALTLRWQVKVKTIELHQKNSELEEEILMRRQAEKALGHSEKRYRQIFEHTGTATIIIKQDGTITMANEEFARLTGYRIDEVEGRMSLQDFLSKEDVETILASVMEHMHGKSRLADHEIKLNAHEGNIKDVLLRVGSTPENSHYIASIVNLTERKKLESQLQQAQKMEAIGRLAGGIAHDFNNILGPIIGYAELALRDTQKADGFHERIKRILTAGKRAQALVNQILVFSRKREGQVAHMDMRIHIHDILKLLRASIPSTIEIITDLTGESTIVMANPADIDQIAMNLCTNAAHSMRDRGGRLEIRIENVRTDAWNRTLNLAPGDYVHLTVSDTGHGIESGVIEKIFEPFFTTKRHGQGTGMGLSIVHGIVIRLGGTIHVTSEVGRGSAFHVYLPRIDAKPACRSPMVEASPQGRGETILVVDDEQAVADLTQEMLEILGYRVSSAANGSQALEIFRSRPEQYDLVLTDHQMPRLTGIQLARELITIRPDISILLSSGYCDAAIEEAANAIGIRSIIRKPFSIDDLAKTVNQAMYKT